MSLKETTEEKMLSARKIANQKPTPYATEADFCRIFRSDMNRLYLLSLLLTGNQVTAEKCFVRGLEDSAKGNAVFKEWAESWARRTIIRNAIQVIRPRPMDRQTSGCVSGGGEGHDAREPERIGAVMELPAFDRFVFVMSVLESYSDQDCSLLLDSTRDEVAAARTRALQQVGRSAQIVPKRVGIGSNEPLVRDDHGCVRQIKVALPTAISAA
jgi:DNA-directed RNA polymerase specialized sigma24 family protein